MFSSRVFSATKRSGRSVIAGVGAALLFAAGAAGASPEAAAPAPAALPPPSQFVSGLDLECFATPGPALNIVVALRHLNPVLQQLGLPTHRVIMRDLVETCVPVMKNNIPPPPIALPFVRHVDLACYRVEAEPLPTPVPLSLKHLNPLLATLPIHDVRLVAPVQLCVPVAKNGVAPPPDVLNLVQFIDLECYRVVAGQHPVLTLGLTQLNPQLTGIPPHALTLGPQPRQMCVPVAKDQQQIPTDVLAVIRWIDLERFQGAPVAAIPPQVLTLNHLNPLFSTLPRFQVQLGQERALMLPVSKNGAAPTP